MYKRQVWIQAGCFVISNNQIKWKVRFIGHHIGRLGCPKDRRRVREMMMFASKMRGRYVFKLSLSRQHIRSVTWYSQSKCSCLFVGISLQNQSCEAWIMVTNYTWNPLNFTRCPHAVLREFLWSLLKWAVHLTTNWDNFLLEKNTVSVKNIW